MGWLGRGWGLSRGRTEAARVEGAAQPPAGHPPVPTCAHPGRASEPRSPSHPGRASTPARSVWTGEAGPWPVSLRSAALPRLPPGPHTHHTCVTCAHVEGPPEPQSIWGRRCHPALCPHTPWHSSHGGGHGSARRVHDRAPGSRPWNTGHNHNDDVLKSVFSIFLGNQDYSKRGVS